MPIPRPLLVAGALLAAALSGGSAAAYRSGNDVHGILAAEVSGRSAARGVLPAFVKSSEYPYDSSPGYSHKLQGVAHDSSHWYMTNRAKLWKIPAHRDLGVPESWSKSARIPSQLRGYDHFGDLDYHDGRLYVPLEGAAPAIGVFDSDLNYITHALLPNALDAPWCAINPADGHLYTSSFRTGVVRKYRMSWTGNSLALTEVASITLRDSAGEPLTLQRVQGGVFSTSGYLYLVSDVHRQGIKGFALDTGRQRVNIPIAFERDEELEGIDLWDLDGGQVPGIDGQIHLQMIDHDWWSDDDFFFKHYRLTDLALKPHL